MPPISNLDKSQPKPLSFSSFNSPPQNSQNYGGLFSSFNPLQNYSSLFNPPKNMATSVLTGKGVPGSITTSIPGLQGGPPLQGGQLLGQGTPGLVPPPKGTSSDLPGQLTGNQSSGGPQIIESRTPEQIELDRKREIGDKSSPYSSAVNTLLNTSKGGSATTQELINRLGSGQNSPELISAIEQQNRLQNAYNQSMHGGAGEGQGIEQGFVTGRQRAIEATYGGQQLAAQQKVANLSGLQGQQLGAIGAALGAANTAQGLQQTGIGTATGYMQPQPYSLLNQPYNPMTDTYGGGGSGGAVNRATQAGQILAAQSNAQTRGTAGADIARKGLADSTDTYMRMSGHAQNATKQAKRVEQILAATGLNDSASTDYNRALQSLGSRFSDQDRQALQSALLEAQSFYGALLAMRSGTPTGNEAQALSSLDITKSAQAISSSIRELDAAVGTMLQTQEDIRNIYQQQLNNSGNPGASGNTNTSTGGGTQHNPDGTLRAVSF